jgi:cytochrome c oxidase subunit 2
MNIEHEAPSGPDPILQAERRWTTVSIGVIVLISILAAFAGIHQATMPQVRVETINPTTLHISGEFVEANLGSAVETDGSVTVRLVAQQYSFTPHCILVPADTRLTIRATSSDAVHGLLIQNTNINTMLVPGYISVQPARFDSPGDHLMPCQEFCGVGHEGMWATVKVIDKAEFMAMSSTTRRLSCVK